MAATRYAATRLLQHGGVPSYRTLKVRDGHHESKQISHRHAQVQPAGPDPLLSTKCPERPNLCLTTTTRLLQMAESSAERIPRNALP